jgi:hypothetical protein
MKNILLNMRNRFFQLIDKLFFSLKGIGFIIATVLMFCEKIPWYLWLLVWIGVVSWRMLERILNRVIDSKQVNVSGGQ